MKITKIKEDITSEIAKSFKNSIAIDTEATGLQIPERDKLSLIQICDEKGNVYIIQPNKENFKAPNLVSVLENEKILKIGHYLRFDKNALEFFLKCKIKNELEKMLIREKRIDIFNKCLTFVDTRIALHQGGFKLDLFEH